MTRFGVKKMRNFPSMLSEYIQYSQPHYSSLKTRNNDGFCVDRPDAGVHCHFARPLLTKEAVCLGLEWAQIAVIVRQLRRKVAWAVLK